MAKEKTLVTFLLDRTGSMQPIKSDTIGAFNAYLETLKKEKKAEIEFTFVQFDSQSTDKICVAEPVKKVKELTDETYQPRACTPLIDAAYKTIKATEAAIEKRGKRKVIVCIQTDGEENASVEHTWDQLNALIKEKTEAGWQFNFMGAGIDAYKQGARMGISQVNTMSYDSLDPQATRAAFVATAQNASMFARGASLSTSYSGLQKTLAKDKFDPNPSVSTTQPIDKSQARRFAAVQPRPIVDDLKL